MGGPALGVKIKRGLKQAYTHTSILTTSNTVRYKLNETQFGSGYLEKSRIGGVSVKITYQKLTVPLFGHKEISSVPDSI